MVCNHVSGTLMGQRHLIVETYFLEIQDFIFFFLRFFHQISSWVDGSIFVSLKVQFALCPAHTVFLLVICQNARDYHHSSFGKIDRWFAGKMMSTQSTDLYALPRAESLSVWHTDMFKVKCWNLALSALELFACAYLHITLWSASPDKKPKHFISNTQPYPIDK